MGYSTEGWQELGHRLALGTANTPVMLRQRQADPELARAGFRSGREGRISNEDMKSAWHKFRHNSAADHEGSSSDIKASSTTKEEQRCKGVSANKELTRGKKTKITTENIISLAKIQALENCCDIPHFSQNETTNLKSHGNRAGMNINPFPQKRGKSKVHV